MIAALVFASAAAAAGCGPIAIYDTGGDFTNAADHAKLSVVEAFHFTPSVENLERGNTDSVGGDISYTLEHFPNHHRALAAMAKLSLREHTPKPVGAKYSVECFFERAIRFRPADATVHSIFGVYLLTQNRSEEALAQLLDAADLDPSNATTHYNLGLLYLKNKDYAKAREHAKRAYALGFPLPGLKTKLEELHQWDEPAK